MSRFPEHVKLGLVHERSQACGEFLEWLLGEKGYHLGEYHKHTDACWPEGESHTDRRRICGTADSLLYPVSASVRRLLAEFFKIDEERLEAEKRTILDEQREVTTAVKIDT
jgi:hypothetical protein